METKGKLFKRGDIVVIKDIVKPPFSQYYIVLDSYYEASGDAVFAAIPDKSWSFCSRHSSGIGRYFCSEFRVLDDDEVKSLIFNVEYWERKGGDINEIRQSIVKAVLDSVESRGGGNVNYFDEIYKSPDFLENYGFTRVEESTTNTLKYVWYEKEYNTCESQVGFVLQVEFEMHTTDKTFLTPEENRSYSFNAVYLKVINRQMVRQDNISYDEETEMPIVIDRYQLKVSTLDELLALDAILAWRKRTGIAT